MKSLLLCLVLFLGCATTSQLERLELDMNKTQIREALGSPDMVRGSIRNKFDQTIEVWQYELAPGNALWSHPENKRTYWLYLCDGRLVQWGAAGDWAREADRITEIRFR